MSGIRRVVFPTLLAAACGCGPSIPTIPLKPRTEPTAKQCTLFERDPLKPDLMAWDAGQRADVSRLREEGVIAVHYEQVGCDVKVEVVPDCIGVGRYRFSWYYENDRLIATDEQEAFAKLPLGAASLRGELASGNAVRIDYVLAGQYALPPTIQVSEFKGPGCARATHYVSALYVGGFARTSGRKDVIAAAAGVFGAEAGAGKKTSELSWRTAGSAEGCREAETKQTESRGCDMPLRLVLRQKDKPESDSSPTASPTTTATSPPTTTTTPLARLLTPPPPTYTPPPPATNTAAQWTPPPPPPSTSSSGCPLGMVEIPGGTFLMGSEAGEEDQKPIHSVTLDSYCLDITEVTTAAYGACVRSGRCSSPNTDSQCNWGKSKETHPVNCVDFTQAQTYCSWVGKTLPTEAQWEYAARGGSRQWEYPWGNEPPSSSKLCWFRHSSNLGTCPAGSYPAGAFGLKDMSGSVWEWTSDYMGTYPTSVRRNYPGPSSGSSHPIRGGSWFSDLNKYVRSAYRWGESPSYRNMTVGFRCARSK